MIALLISIILLQPPQPTPTPVIDPCANMTPYQGALLPDSWILPDGTDCTPYVIELPVEDAPIVTTPAPRPTASPFVLRIMDILNRAHRGF